MENRKNISVEEYLNSQRTEINEDNIRNVLMSMSKRMEDIHSYGYNIGNFNPENIDIINNYSDITYQKIAKINKQNYQQENQMKFAMFILGAFAENFNSVKEYLNSDETISKQILEEKYNLLKNYLPQKEKDYFSFLFNQSQNTKEDFYHKFINNYQQSSSNERGKQRVFGNGHSLLGDDKPNAFVNLFILPGLLIYFFLMVSLVYWILVLK